MIPCRVYATQRVHRILPGAGMRGPEAARPAMEPDAPGK